LAHPHNPEPPEKNLLGLDPSIWPARQPLGFKPNLKPRQLERNTPMKTDIINRINELETQLIQAEYLLNNLELDPDDYTDHIDAELDEYTDPINVAGSCFYPSDILKSMDPIAYRQYALDFIDQIDITTTERYLELTEQIEELTEKLDNLQTELAELDADGDQL
jgi:hypothetical protein